MVKAADYGIVNNKQMKFLLSGNKEGNKDEKEIQ